MTTENTRPKSIADILGLPLKKVDRSGVQQLLAFVEQHKEYAEYDEHSQKVILTSDDVQVEITHDMQPVADAGIRAVFCATAYSRTLKTTGIIAGPSGWCTSGWCTTVDAAVYNLSDLLRGI